MADLCSPMQLARELGIAPAMLYTRIRNGVLTNHAEPNATALIDRREALLALGRQLDDQLAKLDTPTGAPPPSPLQANQVISYSKRNSKGPQIASVVERDDYFTRLRSVEGYELTYRNSSLLTLISDGTITIHAPLELLKMALAALAHTKSTPATAVAAIESVIEQLEATS